MRTTGIVRKIDSFGRIVLPVEVRHSQGIDQQDGMEIFVEGNMIILRKYVPGCSNCGTREIAIKVGTIKLCRNCAVVIARGR